MRSLFSIMSTVHTISRVLQRGTDGELVTKFNHINPSSILWKRCWSRCYRLPRRCCLLIRKCPYFRFCKDTGVDATLMTPRWEPSWRCCSSLSWIGSNSSAGRLRRRGSAVSNYRSSFSRKNYRTAIPAYLFGSSSTGTRTAADWCRSWSTWSGTWAAWAGRWSRCCPRTRWTSTATSCARGKAGYTPRTWARPRWACAPRRAARAARCATGGSNDDNFWILGCDRTSFSTVSPVWK